MFRVTNSMMYNNALINMYRQNEGLYAASNQLSSGKRVNKPSDDPLAIGEIMHHQNRLDRNDRYASFTLKAKGFLESSESLVASATDTATRARELAIGQANGTATAATRLTVSREIDNLISHAIQLGNSKIGSDFMFSGRMTDSAPLSQAGYYQADPFALDASIGENMGIPMSVMASEFLTTDMSPQLSNTTTLASLRLGQGIGTGTFTITDRAGNVGTVNVGTGDTIATLVNAINASGANVTASIAASSTFSLQIVDNNTTNVTGPVVIADTAGGTVASRLGIAGSRAIKTMRTDNLRPAITATTLLSDLNKGAGLALADISVINGAASATVSFAGATTVGDILTALNAAGTNSTAAINAAGTGLTITSNNAATVAFARDIGAGKTAELLGIGGGRNLITNLQRLSAALKANDTKAIAGLMENFTTAIDTTSALRGEIGARVNRLDVNTTQLEDQKVNITTLLSNAQDADMAKAAADFALLQTAYQATAKATAQIIQPTLLNFL